jgi:hypothetical protein
MALGFCWEVTEKKKKKKNKKQQQHQQQQNSLFLKAMGLLISS